MLPRDVWTLHPQCTCKSSSVPYSHSKTLKLAAATCHLRLGVSEALWLHQFKTLLIIFPMHLLLLHFPIVPPRASDSLLDLSLLLSPLPDLPQSWPCYALPTHSLRPNFSGTALSQAIITEHLSLLEYSLFDFASILAIDLAAQESPWRYMTPRVELMTIFPPGSAPDLHWPLHHLNIFASYSQCRHLSCRAGSFSSFRSLFTYMPFSREFFPGQQWFLLFFYFLSFVS